MNAVKKILKDRKEKKDFKTKLDEANAKYSEFMGTCEEIFGNGHAHMYIINKAFQTIRKAQKDDALADFHMEDLQKLLDGEYKNASN